MLEFLKLKIVLPVWKICTFGILVVVAWLLSLTSHTQSNGTATLPGLAATTSFITQNGTMYQKAPETVLSKVDMKHLTDSLRKTLKVTRIEHINTITQVIHDTVPALVFVDTSTGDIKANYEDRWIRIGFLGNTKTDLGSFDFELTTDTVTEINVTKKRLFRATEHSILINHSNKMVKTTQASSISWKEPKVIAVLGPYVGYDAINNRIGAGIAITFNVVGFKK